MKDSDSHFDLWGTGRAPVRTLNLRSWSGFDQALRKLDSARNSTTSGHVLKPPLFRGLGDARWGLETTLERSYDSESCAPTPSLLRYYHKAESAKPSIETFTGRRWEGIPDIPQFKKLLDNDPFGHLDMLLNQQTRIWEYFVYLRHHGFPSPLLDWTASPYVAAFFAVDSPPMRAKRVCVYAISQDWMQASSSDAHLFVVGPYMQTHPRHFLQQCRYTMCVANDVGNHDYLFRPHQSGLVGATGPEGIVLRITLPVRERLTALKHLEQMNINAYSLFGSEDSLIRTVARREMLFRDWK